MSGDERLKIATGIRNSEEAERRHQENLRSADKTRKLHIKIAILSFIAGVATTLIIQWMKK